MNTSDVGAINVGTQHPPYFNFCSELAIGELPTLILISVMLAISTYRVASKFAPQHRQLLFVSSVAVSVGVAYLFVYPAYNQVLNHFLCYEQSNPLVL